MLHGGLSILKAANESAKRHKQRIMSVEPKFADSNGSRHYRVAAMFILWERMVYISFDLDLANKLIFSHHQIYLHVIRLWMRRKGANNSISILSRFFVGRNFNLFVADEPKKVACLQYSKSDYFICWSWAVRTNQNGKMRAKVIRNVIRLDPYE